MSGSSAEREIRDAVVARLRELFTGTRIVHELNVAGQGSNRVDVCAVSEQTLVAVEIKSEKDTLKRLADQWASFNKCCHLVIVAAHAKHFAEHRHEHQRADVPGEMYLNHPDFFGKWARRDHVWHYPRPDRGNSPWEPWGIKDRGRLRAQPRAKDLLELLWAEELREECIRHRIDGGSRRTRPDMILDMVWVMTGQEIAKAVCRQLRKRPFAEADPPIYEARVASLVPA